MRYPDKKLSNEDKLEEGGLADLVGFQRGDTGRTMTGMTARTTSSKGGGSRRPVSQKEKDSEKGADRSALERTTKKKRAKKTSPPDPSREKKKKVVKYKKDQGSEPGSAASEPPPEKKQKKEIKKNKKKEVEADSAEPVPKKKKAKGTLSATLRRAPEAELLPVPEVPQEAALVAMKQRSGMDKQLEAHLLDVDPPERVAQPSQTASSSMVPQVPELEGFLAGLRNSIPGARTQQVVVATPFPNWPKQSWIPVPVAEAQMTKPPTVRELLARQAVRGTPKGPTPEASQPIALRSPLAREVSTMETGEQAALPMDTKMLEELMVPLSGAGTIEPMIPTDLEHQVKTMEEAVMQETVTPVTEEEEPMRLPSIETRTVETQRGNYMMIDTRILDQLGRMEVTAQGPAELVWVASQPKPALGPAEIPGMMEFELVQVVQATTSQTASSTGNQEPAGGKQIGTRHPRQ